MSPIPSNPGEWPRKQGGIVLEVMGYLHNFTEKASMEIDYYISLSSPYTHMGHARFEEMAKAHALTVN